VLAGAVVAVAASEPDLDFLQREILTPLGMDSTEPDIAGQAEPGSAHFYYPRIMLDPRLGLHDAPEADLSCILPTGGFLSNPSNLVRFGSAMMSSSNGINGRPRAPEGRCVRSSSPVLIRSGPKSERVSPCRGTS